MDMPTNNLVSNGAYMVMASLAWTLKVWFGLLLPEGGPWAERRQAEKQKVQCLEFRSFLDNLIHLPCQIVRTSRQIVYRFLSCCTLDNQVARANRVSRRVRDL
jgi:hypothetical protein